MLFKDENEFVGYLEKLLRERRELLEKIRELEEDELKRMPKALKDPSTKENIPNYPAKRIADKKNEMTEIYEHILQSVRDFLAFPPNLSEYFERLRDFYKEAGYKKSVFIMTKFPDKKSRRKRDRELKSVIDAVKEGIRRCGYTPRFAGDRREQMLWENVELHLLGCSKAIAIVEDKYKNELNPNVAMEWGWMRRAGKDVLYLMEKDFDDERADWQGLTKDQFSWDDPEEEIFGAIREWLGNDEEPMV